MNKRHLTAAALASALVLSACGNGDDTATTGTGSEGGSSSAPAADAQGNDADIAFLTGMKPHHEQAVEMSDMVLAAGAPPAVADIARQIKSAQAPEIEEMDAMLADLSQEAAGGSHGGGHGGSGAAGHSGMMSEDEMEELMNATGTEAAKLYLEGMVKHHQGAIEAAETELADGQYEPALDLAARIAKDQAAEITELETLLASL